MNHYALFIKLMERKLASELLTILQMWFNKSVSCVKWNNHFSKFLLSISWSTSWWRFVSVPICCFYGRHCYYKKAELSQRWPRDAPGSPWLRLWLLFPKFLMGFVPIEPINVHAKFEVRSFTRSWDNRGYPKKMGSPWIRPRSIFSKNFNGLLFGWTF